jgi:hypothetical protein
MARIAASTALVLSAVGAAEAAYIHADLVRVSGNTWDASFTVGADPGQTVEAFSIYFDWTQVSNLMVQAAPGDWDALALQGDSGLASDGIFDALALAGGISDRVGLGGFVARFDWADAAGPRALRYSVNDPLSFDVLEGGSLVLTAGAVGGGTSVPEPSGMALLLVGLGAATAVRLRIGRRALDSEDARVRTSTI